MFVAELDRPWLETPFMLQGFMVRDSNDVAFIAEHCDYVFVDEEYHGRAVYLPPRAAKGRSARPGRSPQPGRSGTACSQSRRGNRVSRTRSGNALSSQLRIREDFARAEVNFESATVVLDRTFSEIRKGRHVDVSAVQRAVAPLIDSVFRNKEAVAALVRLKEKGEYLYHHSIATAVWAAILGRQIGLDRDQLSTLVTGAAVLDVGMTQMPMEIVSKAGELTPDELRLVRTHPAAGAALLRASGGCDADILDIVEHHHERLDGSGYPGGLKGDRIPLLARIAGLVDSYDAMITPRAWAQARSSFEATQELADVKEVLFQGALVEQLIQAIGVFPTGSLVELNTGEVGIVVRQNEVRRLKPQIVLVLDTDKRKLDTLEVLDLMPSGEEPGDETKRRWISRELACGAYGIDSEDYFV